MDINQVKAVIQSSIPDADVSVDGDGCSLSITVVSGQFEGQSLLQRQRSLMALFKAQIASGELHALSVKALTPTEV